MNRLFNQIQIRKPKSNYFDLSHEHKTSCNMGKLVPVLAMPTMPGDRIKLGAESLIRFAPMVSPVMHRMDATIHYFFVPNRILWPNWDEFITNKSPQALPYIKAETAAGRYTELLDYMGVPRPIGINTENVSAFPFAAYQCIYNFIYRDQNQIGEVDFELDNGDNSTNSDLYIIRKRAWEHDYFTSALPWAQKGTAVDIPLGDVELKDPWATEGTPRWKKAAMTNADTGDLANVAGATVSVADPTLSLAYDPDGTLQTSPTTINDLRRATVLQVWLEKAARAGTRLTEWIKANFGVISSDARLQQPEYITGVKSPVQISEVLNTTGTVDAPQGNMAGHGVSVIGGNKGSYYCEEHGYIIGILSIMPKTAYMQGLDRTFFPQDIYDYPWPDFAHLGEQEILNKEIYAFQGATGEDTFGYIPRYAEYKFMNNRVSGDFRDTLDYWHLTRKFSAPPALNQAFIEADPTHRIFAVTDPDEQKLYCQIYHHIDAFRPLPKFGTPQWIG